MKPIVVVGSGASAVHFALTALERGRDILMLDVGREPPEPLLPSATWQQLKDQAPDPVEYFLGPRFEAVIYPGHRGEYYGFPPSKTYVFSDLPGFGYRSRGFSPLVSFARGGLAQAWTAGVYPYNDAELGDFPFSWDDISPYYDVIADRIGICGAEDDLARFMPVHRHLMEPLRLDEHSRALLDAYGRCRDVLNSRYGCYVGRSRIATLTRDREGRRACSYLGRCLWGCPTGSLYTPALTLDACRQFPGFTCLTGRYVRHFTVDDRRTVTGVVVDNLGTGAVEEIAAERVVLAAGTLSTCRIFLDSVRRAAGETIVLGGLMDNRQVLIPFVNLSMLRRRYDPDTYQYHQVGMGLEGETAREYVHCQVTTLKTALIHPIVQSLPFDLRTSLAIFANAHAALGLVNVNLCDTRRPGNTVTIEQGRASGPSKLVVHYEPDGGEADRLGGVLARVRRALWKLGCVVPPGLTHTRPMGASVHYAGLLPMSATPRPWTTSPFAESHDFGNLFIVDGTTFPFLPAKNLTFTLMANAARVADRVCE